MGLKSTVDQISEYGGLGIRINRTPAALGVIGNHTLFTVTRLVRINALFGYITATIAAVAATIDLNLVSVSGTLALSSAVLPSNGIVTGHMIQFPDLGAAQPITWVDGLMPIATYATSVGSGVHGWVMSTGVVRLIEAGADSTTGSVEWILFYSPLQDGATVVAS